MQPELVTVVIPTYRRQQAVARAVDALSNQTLAPRRIEVIIVDDGSDDIPSINTDLAFAVRVVRQDHSGPTDARNLGARLARGGLLVFMDDDIELAPDCLAELVAAHQRHPDSVVVGLLVAQMPAGSGADQIDTEAIDFTECLSGLLSIATHDFNRLGGMRDPTGGWPNWDDIDLGYRASLDGMRILRCHQAVAVHHDASAESLRATCMRWHAASFSAARLFARYPEIRERFPMFRDKGPIDWHADAGSLIVRKVARRIASTTPAVRGLEMLIARNGSSNGQARWPPRRTLERWLIGAQISRGYRLGLNEPGLRRRDSWT